MIKAIFIDIDGTLRDSDRNLSSRTINAVKKVTDKGILVILCSGRPRKYTEQISRECFASKYIITSSGGMIYDYEENKVLYVNEMNKEALIKLYEIANPEDVRYIMNVGEGRVVNKVKHADQEIQLDEDIKDFVYNNPVVQCTIADSDIDKIKNLIPKIDKVENVEIKNRHKSLLDDKFKDDKTVFCDIANINSNKGNAVKKLLEILNIPKEDTIAIGDDNNDLSMFEQVGYRVAVDNAIDIVKEKADEITLSNDEDGVAVYLEKLRYKIKAIKMSINL
ncbi:MAG: Cof-type HAD-IIB family hydrolase [Clostridia bacterium]|nr:Cof-type HAD-IIB family hydrolase [Clostridia bacterium]